MHSKRYRQNIANWLLFAFLVFFHPDVLAEENSHVSASSFETDVLALDLQEDSNVGSPATSDENSPSLNSPDSEDQEQMDNLSESQREALFELPENVQRDDALRVDVDRVQRRDAKEWGRMSKDDLREAGFVFEDEQETQTRASATLLAVTAGLAVHGIGHWYVDDLRTGTILLVSEILGLGLIAGGLFVPWAINGRIGSMGFSRPAVYAGTALFSTSYLLDILGTTQGRSFQLLPNTLRTRGIGVQIRYGYLAVDDLPVRSLLAAETDFDLGWGYLRPRTLQDIFLQASGYGGELGWRVWRGASPWTYAFVEADTQYFVFSGLGNFRQVAVSGMLGGSLDLSAVFSQFREVALGAAIGYGQHWYAVPKEGRDSPEFGTSVDFIPLEFFMHFNLSEKLNLRFAYERRDGGWLQRMGRFWGVPSVEVTYQSAKSLDLVLRGEHGEGIGAWGGLKIWFWR